MQKHISYADTHQMIISEVLGFCLNGRVFWGVKNMVFIITEINELFWWFYSSFLLLFCCCFCCCCSFVVFFLFCFKLNYMVGTQGAQTLAEDICLGSEMRFHSFSFISPPQWAHLLGASCTSLWGRARRSLCWQRWLC